MRIPWNEAKLWRKRRRKRPETQPVLILASSLSLPPPGYRGIGSYPNHDFILLLYICVHKQYVIFVTVCFKIHIWYVTLAFPLSAPCFQNTAALLHRHHVPLAPPYQCPRVPLPLPLLMMSCSQPLGHTATRTWGMGSGASLGLSPNRALHTVAWGELLHLLDSPPPPRSESRPPHMRLD